MRKVMPVFIAALMIVVTARAQRVQNDDGWSDFLPPGEGRDLVLNLCAASCHNMKPTVLARKSHEDWANTVNDMILRGATLFPEEIEPVTIYLSKTFGLSVPKPLNVNTATREDLDKLRMKPEIAARIIEARAKGGPFKNAEDLRRALQMEKEDFEEIRYLLLYRD